MKKIVFVTVLVLFLVGCQTGELPPEPGDITGPIGKAVHIYEGYAPPNDVFDNNKMIFNLEQNVINIGVDEDSFTLNLEVSHDDSFIYKYGYYYSKKGWQKYLFDSEPYKESNWIRDYAKKELNLQVDDFNAGENYIVAYSCKRHDGKWKCGCTSTNGPCNQWMLQTYLLLQDELPPEPPTPDDPYMGYVYISPSNSLYRTGSTVNLYAYINSKQDISDQLSGGAEFKVTNEDSGDVTYVSPAEGSGMECNACEGEYCDYYYCTGRYYVEFEPPAVGKYVIEFETRVSNLKQNDGSFEIDNTLFDKYLIEEDIGRFGYRSSYGHKYDERWTLQAQYSASGVSVSAGTYYSEDIMEEFQEFIEDDGTELVQIDGNYLYVNEEIYYTPYYNEKIRRIVSAWMRGGVAIVVEGYGEDSSWYEEVVKAYLEKLPSDIKYLLSDFPEMFVEDGKFNGVIVVDDNAPAEDVISAIDIAIAIQNYIEGNDESEVVQETELGTTKWVSETTKLVSEISDVSAQNVILVGRPAAIDSYGGNELIDGFISYMPGYGYLSFYENGNNIALVVTGQETAGVRLVARVLARGEGAQANFMIVDRDYECKTHEISIDKVMNKAGKIAVSYKTKGTLGEVRAELLVYNGGIPEPVPEIEEEITEEEVSTQPSAGGGGVGVISCPIRSGGCGAGSGSEYVSCKVYTECEYPSLTSDSTYYIGLVDKGCPNVYDKFELKKIVCTDSDGGRQYYVKGQIKIDGTDSNADYCMNQNLERLESCEVDCYVQEFYCDDPFYPVSGLEVHECPYGCEDGACLKGVQGDYYKFEKSDDKLNLYQNLNTIKKVLISTDLDTLADGTFSGKTDVNYKQTLSAPSGTASVVWDDYNDINEEPSLYLKFIAPQEIIKYKLSFSGTAPVSDIDENGRLVDFEGKSIVLLGEEYIVTGARKWRDDSIKLTLIGGEVVDTMEAGETKTYVVNGVEYEVNLIIVSGDTSADAVAKFIINDELTMSLSAGDFYTLKDGISLGIKEVLLGGSGEVDIGLVEFYLGAKRLILDGAGNSLSIDWGTIDDTSVTITVSASESEVGLEAIEIVWKPTSTFYVPIGGVLQESIELEEEFDYLDFLKALDLDYLFNGIIAGKNESVLLNRYDDQSIEIKFTNKNGVDYSFPIFYVQSDGVPHLGKQPGEELYLSEGDKVCDEDSFVIENDGITRVLQLKDIKNTADTKYVKIKDIGTGDTIDYDFDYSNVADIVLDGYTYQVTVVSDVNPGCIELTETTDDSDDKSDIFTQYGTEISLRKGTDYNIAFREAEQEDDGSEDQYGFNLIWDSNHNVADLSNIFVEAQPDYEFRMLTSDRDSTKSHGYTKRGTFLRRDTNGNQDSWYIRIPEKEAVANVYLTSGSVMVPSSGGSGGGSSVS